MTAPAPLAQAPFNPAAFGAWVTGFVRRSNALAGITRDPTAAEVAAHRGLLAARELKVANLEMFVHHVEGSAVLRDAEALGRGAAPPRAEVQADLETLILAARERLWTPRRLHDVYMLLRPFTDANGRSGRALWLWQHVRPSCGQEPGRLRQPSAALH